MVKNYEFVLSCFCYITLKVERVYNKDQLLFIIIFQVEGADSKGPSKEITDIAATAQSLQPTGYTLETTQVRDWSKSVT